MNDECKMMWSEEVAAYFKILSQNLLGGTNCEERT
jgi:hypothetical protein